MAISSNRLARLALMGLEDRSVPASAGTLDPTFGNSGRVQIGFNLGGTNLDEARAIAIQSNGRIVVVGDVAVTGGSNFAAVRLNLDGSLDTTFGGAGKATVAFAANSVTTSSVATSVAIQVDGKIVLAGYATSSSNDFAVTRLNTDGTLDTTFGTGGKATIPFDLGGLNDDSAKAITLQADGKIVLVGQVETATGYDFGVVRLNTNGSLDTSFDVDGKLTVGFDLGRSNSDIATAVVQQTDTKLVIVGTADTATGNDFAVVRLNADGSLDKSFATTGKTTFDFNLGGNNDDSASGVALQSSGKLIVAGTANAQARSAFAVVRMNTDGSVDKTFGTNGASTINFAAGGSNLATVNGVALQSDNRIVLAGGIAPTTNGDFAAARLSPDGALDTTFGTGGKTTIAFNQGGRNNDVANAVAVQADGRVILAGSADTGGANFLGDIAVARLFGNPTAPQPILAGGVANGTARVLNPTSGVYIPTDTLNFFPNFTGTVRVATADVNGDGVADYIGGVGPGGGSRFVVLDGKTKSVINDFSAFEPSFTGGIFIATADLNGDGKADVIVTPDQGGGPVTAIYDGAKLTSGLKLDAAQIVRFLGIDDPAFRGGARPAAGDVTGDGVPDIIVAAGFGGGPRVTIWDGKSVRSGSPSQLQNFFAFETTLRNGTFITAGDINSDGVADLAFGGGPGGAPRVRIYDGKQLAATSSLSSLDALPATAQITNFFAGDTSSRGGVRVSLNDVDGDGRADLTTGSGDGETPRVRVYKATNLLTISSPTPDQDFDPFSVSVPSGVYVG